MSERCDPWQDPQVVAGMERLLAARTEALAGGAKPLGWKLAFGVEPVMGTLGMTGPLVGFLTDATLLASGGEVSVGAWTAPKLEPEIAMTLGPGGAGVAAIAPAIELADLDRPPTEKEAVLAGDIFHRGVVLGDPLPRSSPGPLAVAVERDGGAVAATDDAEATLGRLDDLAAWVGRYLGEFGAVPREGEVIISGSTVPLLDVEPGAAYRVTLAGVGEVSVQTKA